MPRKRPPFVELWRDRHGKVRVYFRKDKGPRLPLPDGAPTNSTPLTRLRYLDSRRLFGIVLSVPRRARWRR